MAAVSCFFFVFVLERLINCTPNTGVPQKTAFSFEVIHPAHHLEGTVVDLVVELSWQSDHDIILVVLLDVEY